MQFSTPQRKSLPPARVICEPKSPTRLRHGRESSPFGLCVRVLARCVGTCPCPPERAVINLYIMYAHAPGPTVSFRVVDQSQTNPRARFRVAGSRSCRGPAGNVSQAGGSSLDFPCEGMTCTSQDAYSRAAPRT
ncbi:hypothetical protein MRB53_042405 [Persea americana]|nr:hypothetical protein MRB53_042405 [Persea americana]